MDQVTRTTNLKNDPYDDPFNLEIHQDNHVERCKSCITFSKDLTINERLQKEKKEKQSVNHTCMCGLYNDDEFRKVTLGPTLVNNMQGMYLKGKSVLKGEIEGCLKINEEDRVFMDNHVRTEAGDGEPHAIDE